MKKKIILSLLVIASMFLMTGCNKERISEEKRIDIISIIEEKNL